MTEREWWSNGTPVALRHAGTNQARGAALTDDLLRAPGTRAGSLRGEVLLPYPCVRWFMASRVERQAVYHQEIAAFVEQARGDGLVTCHGYGVRATEWTLSGQT
jgi:hypothetical protein